MNSIIFSGDLYVPETFGDFSLEGNAKFVFDSGKFHFTNFEAPIYNSGKFRNCKAGPTLVQGKAIIDILHKLNITHLCMANNHIFDRGIDGLKETLKVTQGFTKLGVGLVADEIYDEIAVELDNNKIAVLNVCERQFGCHPFLCNSTGYAHLLSENIPEKIRSLSGYYDKVIIIAHGGLEMEVLPLPQLRDEYRKLVDAGADAIIGHHPHIIQPKELYNGKWIYYSLGNFIFRTQHESRGAILEAYIGPSNELEFNEFSVFFHDNQLNVERIVIDDYTRYFNTPKYHDDIRVVCREFYETHWKSMLSDSTFSLENILRPARIQALIKLLVKALIGRSTHLSREQLLYHLVSFDTNRWVFDLAVREQAEKLVHEIK